MSMTVNHSRNDSTERSASPNSGFGTIKKKKEDYKKLYNEQADQLAKAEENVKTLNEEVRKISNENAKLQEKKSKLEKEIERLQSQVKRLQNHNPSLKEESEDGVHQPTANTILVKMDETAKTRKDLESIIKKMKTLHAKTAKMAEVKRTGTIDDPKKDKLKSALDGSKEEEGLAQEFKELGLSFHQLKKDIENSFDLLDKTIKEATYQPVPDSYKKVISCEIGLPLSVMENKHSRHQEVLRNCKDVRESFSVDYQAAEKCMGEIAGHLNTISRGVTGRWKWPTQLGFTSCDFTWPFPQEMLQAQNKNT